MNLRLDTPVTTSAPGTALWVALIAALTIAGSFVYACAAPFAAIAALAALTMRPLEGLVLVVVTWLVNQGVGFLLLNYPLTASTFGWGAAMAIATIGGYYAVRGVLKIRMPRLVAIVASFVTAFSVYEFALYGYGLAVGYAGDSLKNPEILAQIFLINAGGFVGLLVLHRLAVAVMSLRSAAPAKPVAA